MVRRSTTGAAKAERTFPIRVRVMVPPKGLGQELNRMHEWLRERAPKGRHWVVGDRGPPDATLVFFTDIAVAHAFCDEFACGRIEVSEVD